MRVVTLDGAPGADGQPLFIDFVNTLHWYEGTPVELIGNDADLGIWLRERHLPTRDVSSALTAIHQLRAHMRAVTESFATSRQPTTTDIEAIKAALAGPPGRLAWSNVEDALTPRLSFASDASSLELLAFQIALSLATFLESGEGHRLKLCANPGCGFAFVDTSTNGTRRWCYMRYCGNRLKARAFRRRGRVQATR